MCHSAENSLVANLAALDEMLIKGPADLTDFPALKMKAEDAERMYQAFLKQNALTPEDVFFLTGYRINTSPDPLQIR